MSIYERLSAIQLEMKAPKNKWNDFGGYYSRSAEDILETVKPIASKHGCVVLLSDEVVEHTQGDYIKATATLHTIDGKESVSSDALARIPKEKKKLDDSQVTGSASSYARKYALCGLLAIDDNKDADQLPPEPKQQPQPHNQPSQAPICSVCGKPIKACKRNGKILSPDEVAKSCGGMCVSCYKESNKK